MSILKQSSGEVAQQVAGPREERRRSFALPSVDTDRLRDDWIVVGFSLAIIAIVYAAVTSVDQNMPHALWFMRNIRLYTFVAILVLLAEATFWIVRDKPAQLFRYLGSKTYRERTIRRLAAILPIFAVAIFMPAFSTMKSSIGRFQAFGWDQTFIAWDRAIHGGDAWRLIQPIMGYPEVTAAASWLYHFWFVLIYIGPFCFAFYVADRRLRHQFFLGYLATWAIVGMVFATLFASVGPCFVGPILGLDTFDEQMRYLYSVNEIYPLAVLEVQQQLLFWYETSDFGLGRGITAMPSMHVALTWLYVLAVWSIDKRLRYAAIAFFVVTQLSSVHLAYHYAIDGYVSVFLVTVIWFGLGEIVKRTVRSEASETSSAKA